MLGRITKSTVSYLNKWSLTKPIRTYSDILAKEVYTPCDAVVMHVGKDMDGYYGVILQICADVVVSLKHLATCEVIHGQLVREGTFIGLAKKFCRVELGTLSKDEILETIRIYDKEYFKRDPAQLTPENLGFVKFNHGETEYAYKDNTPEYLTNQSREQILEYSQIEVQRLDE